MLVAADRGYPYTRPWLRQEVVDAAAGDLASEELRLERSAKVTLSKLHVSGGQPPGALQKSNWTACTMVLPPVSADWELG